MNTLQKHKLFDYTRDDQAKTSVAVVDLEHTGHKPGKYFLGSFLENLGHSMIGGVSAELLVNPTFARNPNLTELQIEQLRNNGNSLIQLYLSGDDPAALGKGWTPQIMPTGFGMVVLDDARRDGLPFGWSPLGYPGGASGSLGRLGGAVRLQGGVWSSDPHQRWVVAEDGPVGVRQGIFLPVRRCLSYFGDLWVRIATTNNHANGEVEVGFRRRVTTPDGKRCAGDGLVSVRLSVSGSEWVKLDFQLDLNEDQVAFGEPVDFYVRWLPRSSSGLNLLVDRALVYPSDAVNGIDPEIIDLSIQWPVPLLRWPGGNFVSFYHWRDGVGPDELRPTYPNHAWGGLDYNLFGTDEYMQFCRLIGAEPHMTVNAGTGTPEEAAAWVEYCNGDVTTPMGQLRAKNGHPEPYNVRFWEVGNEPFGFWQGGFHGSDENARRFNEFSKAMDSASPIPIQLIGCGNGFDFATDNPGYNYVTTDGRWHTQLIKHNADRIDYIALHSMPANDFFLAAASHEEATYAVLGQVSSWENRFLPQLIDACDEATKGLSREPIQLAISEWGNVGENPSRLHIENFGGVVYGGCFLNLMIRNAERIPIANTTGFMHGGCLRKAFGITYYDPQYLVIQQYAKFIDQTPVAVKLTGPGFDVTRPADQGAIEHDLSFIDLIACRCEDGKLMLAATNRHLKTTLSLTIRIPNLNWPDHVEIATLAYPEITARTTPAQPDRFAVEYTEKSTNGDSVCVDLLPFSVTWITLSS